MMRFRWWNVFNDNVLSGLMIISVLTVGQYCPTDRHGGLQTVRRTERNT